MQLIEAHHLEALRAGRFGFAYAPDLWLVALIAVALLALAWFSYRRTTRPLSPGWKGLLIALRSAFLILLLLCLLRPVVTTYQVNPQQTYLAVLVDDSQSMSIADLTGGQSRQEAVRERIFSDNRVLDELEETFQVRTFRFDREAGRISSPDELSGAGTASSIGQAMRRVEEQLGGLPLAGVVLVSDGADNSDRDPLVAARSLGAREIPVFTVGVGQERIPSDLAITEVSAARTVLEGTVFSVEVALSNQGYEGQQVELSVRDGDEDAASRTVMLGNEGSTQRFELELSPERREMIVYEVVAEEQEGEIITQNNHYSFLVDNSERPPLDVLYLEGRPRNEYKFIRRAVEGDDSLRLASYLQTGPGKFYRQGIRDPLELNNGFPDSREDLYQYEAVILGDIGRDFFSDEQLEMLRDFVAERGGGLLVNGIMDDAFIDSPLADVLPVNLVEGSFLPQNLQGGTRRGDHPTGQLFSPGLTRNGQFEPMLRLASEDSANARLWREMPELQGIYVTGRAKPGATVLIEHPRLQFQNQSLPVLATQRYGSGRSMSLTTASTWRWQMFLPSDDQKHERLWRQMLRWLTVSALDRVTVEFDREFYNVGDEVNVKVTVLDENYEPANDASLWLQRRDPQDQVADMPMEWDIEEDGVYRAGFRVEQEGIFELLVDVASAAGSGRAEEAEKRAAFVVTPARREFSRAAMDAGLLQRIADSSGGQYFNISQSGELADAVEYTPNAHSMEVQEDLWNRALVLILLVALLCLDWVLRRYKGLS